MRYEITIKSSRECLSRIRSISISLTPQLTYFIYETRTFEIRTYEYSSEVIFALILERRTTDLQIQYVHLLFSRNITPHLDHICVGYLVLTLINMYYSYNFPPGDRHR